MRAAACRCSTSHIWFRMCEAGEVGAATRHESITGLQIIKARRANFILPNGQLDKSRWQTVSG
jgi:hypothetical protein